MDAVSPSPLPQSSAPSSPHNEKLTSTRSPETEIHNEGPPPNDAHGWMVGDDTTPEMNAPMAPSASCHSRSTTTTSAVVKQRASLAEQHTEENLSSAVRNDIELSPEVTLSPPPPTTCGGAAGSRVMSGALSTTPTTKCFRTPEAENLPSLHRSGSPQAPVPPEDARQQTRSNSRRASLSVQRETLSEAKENLPPHEEVEPQRTPREPSPDPLLPSSHPVTRIEGPSSPHPIATSTAAVGLPALVSTPLSTATPALHHTATAAIDEDDGDEHALTQAASSTRWKAPSRQSSTASGLRAEDAERGGGGRPPSSLSTSFTTALQPTTRVAFRVGSNSAIDETVGLVREEADEIVQSPPPRPTTTPSARSRGGEERGAATPAPPSTVTGVIRTSMTSGCEGGAGLLEPATVAGDASKKSTAPPARPAIATRAATGFRRLSAAASRSPQPVLTSPHPDEVRPRTTASSAAGWKVGGASSPLCSTGTPLMGNVSDLFFRAPLSGCPASASPSSSSLCRKPPEPHPSTCLAGAEGTHRNEKPPLAVQKGRQAAPTAIPAQRAHPSDFTQLEERAVVLQEVEELEGADRDTLSTTDVAVEDLDEYNNINRPNSSNVNNSKRDTPEIRMATLSTNDNPTAVKTDSSGLRNHDMDNLRCTETVDRREESEKAPPAPDPVKPAAVDIPPVGAKPSSITESALEEASKEVMGDGVARRCEATIPALAPIAPHRHTESGKEVAALVVPLQPPCRAAPAHLPPSTLVTAPSTAHHHHTDSFAHFSATVTHSGSPSSSLNSSTLWSPPPSSLSMTTRFSGTTGQDTPRKRVGPALSSLLSHTLEGSRTPKSGSLPAPPSSPPTTREHTGRRSCSTVVTEGVHSHESGPSAVTTPAAKTTVEGGEETTLLGNAIYAADGASALGSSSWNSSSVIPNQAATVSGATTTTAVRGEEEDDAQQHMLDPTTTTKPSPPSLPLLLHILSQYTDRSPPLALANATPFLRVLCECHTTVGYTWGKLTTRRSPCVDGAVVVEVPGEVELKSVMWWLERGMREEELDHYYGSRSSCLWGSYTSTGAGAGKGDPLAAYGMSGGGVGGEAADFSGGPQGYVVPFGASSLWPSPPLGGAESKQHHNGGGGGGAYYFGVGGAGPGGVGGGAAGTLGPGSADGTAGLLYRPLIVDEYGVPLHYSSMAFEGGGGGGGFGWEEEYLHNAGNDDVMFFEGADSRLPRRDPSPQRPPPQSSLTSWSHEDGRRSPTSELGAGRALTSPNPAISPSSARRRRRQRAREAYTTRILHVICIGHQRAKAMLAAASLWMMRTLSISKIELSVDYQPLHLLGSIWDRYTQLSKLQLIATNCLGPRGASTNNNNNSSSKAGNAYGGNDDFLLEHQASRFPKYPHEQVRQRHLQAGGGGALRGLEHLPLLRELDLSSSLIDGIGFMGKAPALEKLNLSSTSISNPGLVGLAESASLKVLILFQCASVSSVKCLTPLYGSLISDGNGSSSGGSTSGGSLLPHGHHLLPHTNNSSGSMLHMCGSIGSASALHSGHEPPAPPPPMNLELLDLRGTSVGTLGISGLGSLPRLRFLRLGRTKITHLDALSDSPSLTHVDLENCTTLHPEEGLQGLECIPNLSYLNLTRSNAGALQPLASSRSLQCLVACRVGSLTGRLRDLFLRSDELLGGSCLWALIHLDLSSSPIDASSVQVLSMCVNLQYVNLSRTGALASVAGLEELPHLREIHVAHTQVTSLNCLRKAPSLERLNAAHTHVEDDGILELSAAQRLLFLDLTDTQVSRVGHLSACPCLKVLILTSTLVSSHGLRGLETSATLEELYLNEALVKHFTTWDVTQSAVLPFATDVVEAALKEMKEKGEGGGGPPNGRMMTMMPNGVFPSGAVPNGPGLEVPPTPASGLGGAAADPAAIPTIGAANPHTGITATDGPAATVSSIISGGFPSHLMGTAAAGSGEENPALTDARREAVLKHLWKSVERIALEAMAHVQTLRETSVTHHASPACTPAGTGFPSGDAAASFTCSPHDVGAARHMEGIPGSRTAGDAAVSASLPPEEAQLLREVLHHVAPHLMQEVLDLTLGQRQGCSVVRLGGHKTKQRPEASKPKDEEKEALDHGKEMMEGLSIPNNRTRRKHNHKNRKKKDEEGLLATDGNVLESLHEGFSSSSSSEWSRTRETSRRSSVCSDDTITSPNKKVQTCMESPVEGNEAGDDAPEARDTKEKIVFYPSLWKLSVAHTRHRSSGLLGVLQLPRLVELDVTDTWIDSSIGSLFPFASVVRESFEAALAERNATKKSNQQRSKHTRNPRNHSASRHVGPSTTTSSAPQTRGGAEHNLGERTVEEEQPTTTLEDTEAERETRRRLKRREKRMEKEKRDAARQQLSSEDRRETATVVRPAAVEAGDEIAVFRGVPMKKAKDATESELLPPRSQETAVEVVLHCTSQFPLLHQRLACFILRDVKLQQMSFLRGIQYAEALQYVTLQSCQPSLSHMGINSLESLAACVSLETLNLADTDITSEDMACFQVTDIPQGTALQAATLLTSSDDDQDDEMGEEDIRAAAGEVVGGTSPSDSMMRRKTALRWRPGMPPPPPPPPPPPQLQQQQQRRGGGAIVGGRRGFRPYHPPHGSCGPALSSEEKAADAEACRAYLHAQRQHHRYLRYLALTIPISTHLAALNLSGTIISDLRFMCFQRRVKELRLSATVVRDLTPLRFCTALQLLDVTKTRVLDLTPLKRCRGIRYLYAADTFTTQEGIRCLPHLSQLEVIDLSGTPISSILNLRGLPQLRHLRIRNSAVPRAESKCFPPYITVQQ